VDDPPCYIVFREPESTLSSKIGMTKDQADTRDFAIITPVIRFTDIRDLTGFAYPQVKEIADYLVHQLPLQETGGGWFVLADTIRRGYENAIEQRDHVGTMLGPCWDYVGIKLALGWHQVGTKLKY